MIDIFYVVAGYVGDPTLFNLSLYEICITSANEVSVQKIGLIGHSDIKKGRYLENKGFLGITRNNGFICYSRSGQQRVDNVSTINKGAKSAPIIAMFKNKREAKQCFTSSDLNRWDQRFIKSTEEVLREIGVETSGRITLDESLALGIREGRLLELLR